LADALRAAAREGTLPAIVATGDEIGGQAVVDATLVELCGDPGFAEDAFRMTRDRLSRRAANEQGQLAAAHARALVAAPNAVSVQDYARYLQLIAPRKDDESDEEVTARMVDPDETARAMAAAPKDPAVRATHALALLKAGRAQEAVGAFDDLTVFYNRVPPALQAVICRVLADGGQKPRALEAVQAIDEKSLTTNEKGLLEGLN
jgi:predicted Zn-dependent protease